MQDQILKSITGTVSHFRNQADWPLVAILAVALLVFSKCLQSHLQEIETSLTFIAVAMQARRRRRAR